jgi:UDP-GlcNAc:undecaprenyl-phosphate GlcNAc-1-phosphate transferase
MHFTSFFIAFTFSIIFTFLIRKLALRYQIVDQPEIGGRKIHLKPVPLLGGLAIFLSFFLVLHFLFSWMPQGDILSKHLMGIFLGSLFLMIGGFLDDKFKLPPKKQIIWPILAVLAIIISGVGVKYINNPFGSGFIHLAKIKWQIFNLQGVPYYFTLWSDLFTFVWLMGMIYTTKFLDGLDGLVSGITSIGALIIFFLSLYFLGQPQTAFLAIILAGACLGFLIFNFHPAKIFLGESGGTFCGFMLGVLAIISGSKVATTLLIMGIPILDVSWVILRRVFREHHLPWLADQGHLHFRLLNSGFSHRQAVLFLYFLSLSFGLFALFLQTQGKILALGILGLVMLILVLILSRGLKELGARN